jgi:hypothetical protein
MALRGRIVLGHPCADTANHVLDHVVVALPAINLRRSVVVRAIVVLMSGVLGVMSLMKTTEDLGREESSSRAVHEVTGV